MKNILHIPQKKESLVTEGELNLAKEIQLHLLPKNFPFPNKIEVGTLYQPARKIGGDFYDAIQVDDRKAAFLIGDVSGHSVPAALFMTQCITLLKALIKMDFSLLKIAETANKILFDYAQADMFATVFISIYDSHYHQLSFINAGHPPPLLLRSTWNSEDRAFHPVTLLKSEGIALNCFSKVTLEEKKIQLFNGDILLLYTDGLIEATDKEEKQFGEANLKELLSRHKDLSSEEIAKKVLLSLNDYAKGTPVELDDMAALVLKFRERQEEPI